MLVAVAVVAVEVDSVEPVSVPVAVNVATGAVYSVEQVTVLVAVAVVTVLAAVAVVDNAVVTVLKQWPWSPWW